MIIGAQPSIFWFWFTWQIFPDKNLVFYLAFSFFFVIGLLILITGTTIIAKFFLMITNLFHHPREGVFERDKNDKDYCYWSLRAVIRKWPIWLARQLGIHIFVNAKYNG